MKVKLIEFYSPYSAELQDATTKTDNGLHKITWGDKRESTLKDDVKPIVLETKNRLGQTKRTLAYIKARDNFLSLNEDHFIVTGRLSNEQLTEVANFEAIDQLNRYTANKGASSLFGKIIIILLLVGLAVGGYYVLQYLTGGAIQLPKLM